MVTLPHCTENCRAGRMSGQRRRRRRRRRRRVGCFLLLPFAEGSSLDGGSLERRRRSRRGGVGGVGGVGGTHRMGCAQRVGGSVLREETLYGTRQSASRLFRF